MQVTAETIGVLAKRAPGCHAYLAEIIKDSGRSQAELARMLGVSQASLNAWLVRERWPANPSEMLPPLLVACGVDGQLIASHFSSVETSIDNPKDLEQWARQGVDADDTHSVIGNIFNAAVPALVAKLCVSAIKDGDTQAAKVVLEQWRDWRVQDSKRSKAATKASEPYRAHLLAISQGKVRDVTPSPAESSPAPAPDAPPSE